MTPVGSASVTVIFADAVALRFRSVNAYAKLCPDAICATVAVFSMRLSVNSRKLLPAGPFMLSSSCVGRLPPFEDATWKPRLVGPENPSADQGSSVSMRSPEVSPPVRFGSIAVQAPNVPGMS